MLTVKKIHNRDMKALCQEKRLKMAFAKNGFSAKNAAEAMIYGKMVQKITP